MPDKLVKAGEYVTLIAKSEKKKFCILIEDRSQKFTGLGVFNPIKLLDMLYGSQTKLGSEDYWILPSNQLDILETIQRKAQIILPIDSALIGLYGNIVPGSIVVEGGLGSGALTIYLLNLIGSQGKLTTYEIRDDFAKVGIRNIEKGVPWHKNTWNLKIQDITKGIDESSVDAVILDIPNPWDTVAHAGAALNSGGILVSYVPTINQVEKLVVKLNESNFIEITAFENLKREMAVKPGATRPAYDMLGHTGYIVSGRKVTNYGNKL